MANLAQIFATRLPRSLLILMDLVLQPFFIRELYSRTCGRHCPGYFLAV